MWFISDSILWRVNEIYFCFCMIGKDIKSLKDIVFFYIFLMNGVKFYMNEEVINIVFVL